MARTSVLTGGTNSAQTTSEDLNGLATDLVSDGVVGALTNTSGVAPMTGGLSVNAQGSPNTTTAVGAGVAYVTATPTSQGSQRLRVKIDAQNVTHTSNSSGGTRYDWIYVKVDAALAANPISDMSTTGTIVVSRSTSSSTDNGTPPAYGYHIATITLTNGFTSVTNGNIADNRVQTGAQSAYAQLMPGMVVQRTDSAYTAVATTTTVIPGDDTIPQNSEGAEFMTLSVIPKSATNKLVIHVEAMAAANAVNNVIGALFQDSNADAIAASKNRTSAGDAMVPIVIDHSMTAGTTSSTTFKVRLGPQSAGTLTFNGEAGVRQFGAITKSFISVTEYKA